MKLLLLSLLASASTQHVDGVGKHISTDGDATPTGRGHIEIKYCMS